MKSGVVLVALLVLGVAACGGDDEAEPLTLQQRQPNATETQGYEQDPNEVGWTASTVTEAVGPLHEILVAATEKDAQDVLEKAGFVAAISDTLFRPAEPGGPHAPSRPHLAFVVGQFESEDGASEVVDFLSEDARQPCPGSCADQVSEFDVDGIPNARTARRVATKERIEALGRPGDVPHESYDVAFADGDFAYVLSVFGPPGSVSEQELERLAKSLYDRVEGAPTPDA